jgi:hypothetical protein
MAFILDEWTSSLLYAAVVVCYLDKTNTTSNMHVKEHEITYLVENDIIDLKKTYKIM